MSAYISHTHLNHTNGQCERRLLLLFCLFLIIHASLIKTNPIHLDDDKIDCASIKITHRKKLNQNSMVKYRANNTCFIYIAAVSRTLFLWLFIPKQRATIKKRMIFTHTVKGSAVQVQPLNSVGKLDGNIEWDILVGSMLNVSYNIQTACWVFFFILQLVFIYEFVLYTLINYTLRCNTPHSFIQYEHKYKRRNSHQEAMGNITSERQPSRQSSK